MPRPRPRLPRLPRIVSLFLPALGLHTVDVSSHERRAERRECPSTPVNGKEVCFVVTGETFREGREGRVVGEHQEAFDNQELASRSVVKEIFDVFDDLCARVSVFLHTKAIPQRGEKAMGMLQTWYGGSSRLPREHMVAEPAGTVKRIEVLPDFAKRYPDHACDGGVMWIRPDLIFSSNMSAVLRTAGASPGHRYEPASADYPLQRYSFIEDSVRPVDLGKMMFLYPCFPWDKASRNVTTSDMETKNVTHWRISDMWMWIPGRLWEDRSLALRDLPINHYTLFELHKVGVPESQLTAWVRENVAFLDINSYYDSNSLRQWNPFYRMSRGPMNHYIPSRRPSRSNEEHIQSVFYRP